MISFIIAQVAQQATGIPAEVWVAVIAAISGSLIKPIFDLISQRLTVQRENEKRNEDAADAERAAYKDRIRELESQVAEVKQESFGKVVKAREEEDVWREKYFAALERFNKAYGPQREETNLDLSDPSVLREIIKHIATE